MSLSHLDEEVLEKVCERLWQAEISLKGLGGLLTQSTYEPCFSGDEISGVGQIIKRIGEDLEGLEDLLRGLDRTSKADS